MKNKTCLSESVISEYVTNVLSSAQEYEGADPFFEMSEKALLNFAVRYAFNKNRTEINSTEVISVVNSVIDALQKTQNNKLNPSAAMEELLQLDKHEDYYVYWNSFLRGNHRTLLGISSTLQIKLTQYSFRPAGKHFTQNFAF